MPGHRGRERTGTNRGAGDPACLNRGRSAAARSWSDGWKFDEYWTDALGSSEGRVGQASRWVMLTPVEPPQVTIEVASVDPESVPGRWRGTSLIRNRGSPPPPAGDTGRPHPRLP